MPVAFQSYDSVTQSNNPDVVTPALDVGKAGGVAVAIRTANTSANGHGIADNVAHTIDQAQGQAVQHRMQVRRLMPVECERLQGFPDNYTRIPWRNKSAEQCPDGPRYKALGNSMAVNVMRWIGDRIQSVEYSRELREQRRAG